MNKIIVCCVLQGWFEGRAVLGRWYIIFCFSLSINQETFSVFPLLIHTQEDMLYAYGALFLSNLQLLNHVEGVTQLFLVMKKYSTVQKVLPRNFSACCQLKGETAFPLFLLCYTLCSGMKSSPLIMSLRFRQKT